MKPIIFGVVYCIVASYLLIGVVKSGYALPSQVTPPTDWPMTQKSRDQYQPFNDFRFSVLSYVR